MPRVYEVWKGSNRFLCWGRCMFGPDVRSLIASIFLISVPGGLFCAFVAWPLVHKFTGAVAVLAVAIVFLIWVLGILLYTSSRDPGIVPRNAHPPEPDADTVAAGGEDQPRRLPRTKDVVINNVTVKIKYCDTCMLYRPPRCSHCSICNNCVERFDHHCPWVGQCIGKRNYRFFYMFVVSATLLCVYVFGFSAIYIKVLMDDTYGGGEHRRRTVWQAMGKAPVAVVLMGFTFIAVWFVGGLATFHTFLMATNQTTYENFRYRYDKKVNPYNRGVFRNIGETLCSKVPPSRNNFRAHVGANGEVSAQGAGSMPRSTHGHPPRSGSGMGGVVQRIPSRPMSRGSSRASSGTRSPATKDYQQLEMQRLPGDTDHPDPPTGLLGRAGVAGMKVGGRASPLQQQMGPGDEALSLRDEGRSSFRAAHHSREGSIEISSADDAHSGIGV
eukprot:TRINITY_DN857_c0_g2_i1.p1 TRINITY_DN857_c0_g2~~TRINITY_DN857_c0_g2_i1.p1  ORF type:complete len:442 (+),score=58.93 TRINITY_DN857_c0_g2_i1:459-1784(+)